MIDTVQLVLLFVIVTLAVLLIVLGIQIFFILRDFRRTITKANKVLDNTELITENIAQPVSFITNLFGGGQSFSVLTKLLISLLKGDDRQRR